METQSAEQTEQAGIAFAATLSPGDVVTLDGDLGAGKTAFARGILHGLGYPGRVTSPTFAIVNEYDTDQAQVAHFDMYRIVSEDALWELGFDEYLDGERIVLIEWSGNICGALPTHYKKVHILRGVQPDTRIITIREVDPLADTQH